MKRMMIIMFLMLIYSSQYIRESSPVTISLDSMECSVSSSHKKLNDPRLTPGTEDTIRQDDAGMTGNDAARTSGSDHKYPNRFISVE
jgi:hypothetical protein